MMKLLALQGLVAVAAAQSILQAASFGHNDRISPEGHHAIPGWRVSGSHHDFRPDVLSDRVIMTPPGDVYREGSLWTEQPMAYTQWTVDIEFRVNGPDHGSGTLSIYYTKENQNVIDTKNVYMLEHFDGLAIMIDNEGSNGQLRAFLNDGTINYASHPHVESLPFGHCDVNYRNRGFPTKLQLQQDSAGFQVTVDGRPCFRSNKVILPAYNFFGVTATSGEIPDSIEVSKFITVNAPSAPQSEQSRHQENHDSQDEGEGGWSEHYDDNLASTIRDQQAQFADLHDRLQALGHNMENLFKEITRQSSRLTTRVESLNGPLAKIQDIQRLEAKIGDIENKLNQLRGDQKDWSGHFNEIQNSLKSRHDALLASFPESMSTVIASKGSKMELIVGFMIAFQLVLGLGYFVYKRRQSQMPKKYL